MPRSFEKIRSKASSLLSGGGKYLSLLATEFENPLPTGSSRSAVFGTSARVTLTFVAIIHVLALLDTLFPVRPNIGYSRLVLDRNGESLQGFLSVDHKWRMELQPGEISPELRSAFLVKEDKYFELHPGFNPVSIVRATLNNIVHGQKRSGASTITMQVVRLLEKRPRTFASKIVEVIRAVQLENSLSKAEILRLYLNLVPYGSNIEGVKSACVLYLQRSPLRLSPAQVALLTVIPNKPTSFSVRHYNDDLRAARNRWILSYTREGIFDPAGLSDALSEPLTLRRAIRPEIAPHLGVRLARSIDNRSQVLTTIDARTQRTVLSLAENHLRRLRLLGIANLSAVVVDNQSSEIRAYIGNPDFLDAEHHGQVDGVRGKRSPGSALKPLVYGLAIDRGLICPKTVVFDVPTDFGGYAPDNFDERFRGPVTAAHALAQSLNVPAVELTSKLGVPSLVDALDRAGFQTIRQQRCKLGLSLALGGCGVTLEEMCSLYRAIANRGIYSPLRLSPFDPKVEPKRIVSEEAAWIVTNILTDLKRPDMPNGIAFSYSLPKVAWKTGTSYGRRDAWSIGYNSRFTVGVWAGNFNGIGSPWLTGSEAATPLLFEIFNSIDYRSDTQWHLQPRGIDFRLVCSESGAPPGEYCTDQIVDQYIPGVSATLPCEHVKEVQVSADASISYCSSCLPENGYKRQVYRLIPDVVQRFYRSENIAFKSVPVHNPECTRVFTDNPPRIVSPVANMEYILEPGLDQKLTLSASAASDVQRLLWYINDRYVGQTAPDADFFFSPPAGAIKVQCVDDKGRKASVSFSTRFLRL